MRKLFWKFFFSFWLAQALLLALAILVANLGFLREQIRTVQDLRDQASNLAPAAVQAFEANGSFELSRFLDSHDEATGARFWLFDAQKNELSGNPFTTTVVNAVRGSNDEKSPVVTIPVRGAHGAAYTFAGQLRTRRMPGPPARVIVRQLLLSLVVSAIVCLLLAHSLTKPIVQLRETASKLASGRLEARVGARVAKRDDEIGQLGCEFDRMASQIEALVQSQKQLLRDISHDLRSPLQRLRTALELARRGGATQPAQLDRIEREAVRINSFVEQLLTLARLESTETAPNMEPLSLSGLAERVVADARLEAERAGCELALTTLGPYLIRGNSDALTSALENIVRNGIQHAAGGKLIEIGLHGETDHAVLSVRDHGPGVPNAELPRVFEPFYRVDAARSSSTGGSGLGLAIAARVVALHGGSITAQNAAPSGLLITVRLPMLTA